MANAVVIWCYIDRKWTFSLHWTHSGVTPACHCKQKLHCAVAPHTSLINWRVTLKTSSNYHIKEQHQLNLLPTFTHVPLLTTVLSFIPVAELTFSHWYHWISFHLWSKHQVTKARSICPALEEFYEGLLFDECWPWQKGSLTRGSERSIWVAAQKIDCTTVRLQIATVCVAAEQSFWGYTFYILLCASWCLR